MSDIDYLWHRGELEDWELALSRYWSFVKEENRGLEKQMQELDPSLVMNMNAVEWYRFLHDEYFRWKYTDARYYKWTTKHLGKYLTNNALDELDRIKAQLFGKAAYKKHIFDGRDIELGLKIGNQIHGLGIPGASGLLSLLFPRHFGTVDQFVVKALCRVHDHPELEKVRRMYTKIEKSQSLSPRDGVVLVTLMRQKADELNQRFSKDYFTPRLVDMVLWACREDLCKKPARKTRCGS